MSRIFTISGMLFIVFYLTSCGGQEETATAPQFAAQVDDASLSAAGDIELMTRPFDAIGYGLDRQDMPSVANDSFRLGAEGIILDMNEVPEFTPRLGDGLNDHWTSLNNAATGANAVYAIAVSGSVVYVGGTFTAINGVTVSRIAKWNGSVWSALGSGMNGAVRALVVDSNGDLYAGGEFTTAGGVAVNRIAKWNGSTWSVLGTGMNGSVRSLVVSGATLYAAGDFTTAGGVTANRVAQWNGTAWSAMGNGMNNIVYAIAMYGSSLYAGGDFTQTGANKTNHIAQWDGSSWVRVGGTNGKNGMDYSVYTLAVSATSLYAGGNFTTVGGTAMSRVARWNGAAWSAMGTGIGVGAPDEVYALAASGSDLYAAGQFTSAGGVTVSNIARWNGAIWSALGSGLDSTGWALAADGSGYLYAGGAFATAGNKQSRYIAQYATGAVCGDGIQEGGEQCEVSGLLWGACCDQNTCLFKGITTVCRASTGACDLAENCDGSSAACPADTNYASAATVCRVEVAGGCDVEEKCTGASNVCPADAVRASGTECRAATGDCDMQETCNGTSNACPADSLMPSSTVCRPSAGDCDLAENCTGSTKICPADAVKPVGTSCRASAGICDVAEACTGAVACPADSFLPDTTVCRASTGTCDPAENCTGAGATCPGDLNNCTVIMVIGPVNACARRTTGTISFTAIGATSVTCRLDKPNSSYTEWVCSSPAGYTLDGGDGLYTFTVTGRDDEDNIGTASTSFTLNTTAPTLQWYLPANGTYYYAGSSVPSFVYRTKNLEAGELIEIWDADANAKVAEKATTGSLCNTTEDVSIPLDLPDKCGTYKLYAKVSDSVSGTNRYTDNLTTTPATQRTYTFDRVKPVITAFVINNDNGNDILVPAEDNDGDPLNGMQADIAITVQDAIDIGRTVTLRNKTTGGIYTAAVAADRTVTFINITIPEGVNNFGATLLDCNGNLSSEWAKTITVDTIAPTLLFQGPTGTTPGYPLWLTARDGTVVSDELTVQQLKFKINGDWNGATPSVKHYVYDYTNVEVGSAYTYTSGEMSFNGTEITIALDASADPATPLAYNKHKFEVMAQDANGNARTVSRTYEVDPITPNAVIAYPTDQLVLGTKNPNNRDEDPATPGVQFTLKLNLTKLATPTGTASTIDILAIPILAFNGAEDTTRSRKSWNGFSATANGTNQTFPNNGSFLTLGDGLWRLSVKVTDDHQNIYDTATLPVAQQIDVDVQTTVSQVVLKLSANDKVINGTQSAPTWLNGNEGTGFYDLYVETDAPNGSNAAWISVNGGSAFYADIAGGRADFTGIALNTGGAENTLAVSVDNGTATTTETYYVRADATIPSLDPATGVKPTLYVTDMLWEIGYGWNDDIDHDTVTTLELDGASVGRLIFTIGNIEEVVGFAGYGTVTLTAVSPIGAIGGTTSIAIAKIGTDMVAEFTDLTFEDSVTGGQTDIEMLVTITEQPSGTVYEKTIIIHLNLERPVVTPTVTTDPARGEALVQWVAIAGNNRDRVSGYQVKYEQYSGSCSLDDGESLFDSGAAVLPFADYAVADPSIDGEGFIAPKEEGQSQSYQFHFKKRQNTAQTVTADIHQNGDKYCFAIRTSDSVYAQDGTVLAVNTATAVADKGGVRLTQSTLIAASTGTHNIWLKNLGDINDDGRTDFVISDLNVGTAPMRGMMKVFISTVGGAPTAVNIPRPDDAGDYFGGRIATGDFNGDGHQDVAAIDLAYTVHLFYGTANSISTTRGNKVTITTGAINDIDGIGDFNGDGCDDIAIGQSTYNSNAGRVFVLYGAGSGCSGNYTSVSGVSYIGAAPNDKFGYNVRRTGNIKNEMNGGRHLGSFVGGNYSTASKLKVIYGEASPSDTTISVYDATVSGLSQLRTMFYGDLNGDAYSDFALVEKGKIKFFFGSVSGTIFPGTWTEGVNQITQSLIMDETIGAEGSGWGIGSSGVAVDVDGDGHTDFSVSGEKGQYLYSGTEAFFTQHPSVYQNLPIVSGAVQSTILSYGVVVCNRNSGFGNCTLYYK